VCVAILQTANAGNHFSPGEATNFFRRQPETHWRLAIFPAGAASTMASNQYGGISNLAADRSVTGRLFPRAAVDHEI
jgi:hypothetical protein